MEVVAEVECSWFVVVSSAGVVAVDRHQVLASIHSHSRLHIRSLLPLRVRPIV